MTRRAELAVRALVALAAAEGRTKGPALAEALDTTAGFTAHVIGPLVKAGWVRSEPGPTGGYVLSADLSALSVLEVIEAIDGPTDSGRCVVTELPCTHTCVLHDAWQAGRAELVRALDTRSVADLAKAGGR